MAGILKAIVIEPGCDPEVVEMDTSLKSMQKAVGGWLEAVYGYDDDGDMVAAFFCNEEGKLLGLPVNVAATHLWHGMSQYAISDMLCGPVVVLGPPDENGDETSVPDFVVDMIQ